MSAFRASYKGIGQLLRSEFLQAEMRKRAEKVKAAAIAIAPDQAPIGVGYIDEFEVESGIRVGKTRRAFGRVRNNSPHAIYVEFGGKDTPKHRTLGKALDAATNE